MLFLLFGSSGAGKTVALGALRGRIADLAIHDFDEIGVPAGADRTWRQRADELWLRRALAYQDQHTIFFSRASHPSEKSWRHPPPHG